MHFAAASCSSRRNLFTHVAFSSKPVHARCPAAARAQAAGDDVFSCSDCRHTADDAHASKVNVPTTGTNACT